MFDRFVARQPPLPAEPTRGPAAWTHGSGGTWPYRRNRQTADLEYRETEAGYAYPSVVPARDGGPHVAFSYLRKAIKYLRVTEEWVRRGERGG